MGLDTTHSAHPRDNVVSIHAKESDCDSPLCTRSTSLRNNISFPTNSTTFAIVEKIRERVTPVVVAVAAWTWDFAVTPTPKNQQIVHPEDLSASPVPEKT
mmetsp:Transcript_17848/g.35963  ORF Transcript_17848/g.35963 Transcript_17848/m.35963 type:complete len:100 (-) Transcript_17848:1340-1639(-)